MIKKTTKSSTGTSFYGDKIYNASYNALVKVLGDAIHCTEDGDKINFYFIKEVKGQIFTVYDYKENNFNKDKLIDWHIGAKNKEVSNLAHLVIIRDLYEAGLLNK